MKPLSVSLLAVAIVSIYLLTSCDSTPKAGEGASTTAPAAPVKPPQPYTGLQAFSCISGLAQKWSPDVIPVRLESQPNSEANGQGGKSTVWKAGFISPSRRKLKYFYCSGSRLKESPPYGPSAGSEEPYGSDVPALGFQSLFLKTDSDKAFAVAQEHGGANLIKKNPDQVVTYFVLWNQKQQALHWYVMYGKDKESAAGTGIVNALTGVYVGIGK
ncbi:MAG: hypothetical protein HY010_13325 [Acidobacteria bacterium]|nr:hypothetical protein [Acidobacteriota bacterium]